MYQPLLETIVERMREYGKGLQPPCLSSELKNLKSMTIREFGSVLPDAYGLFLALTNGLDWNGLVVYASEKLPITGYTNRYIEGFINGNLDYREFDLFRDYLIFADGGGVLFTYHIATNQYQVITTVGLTVLESFGSFDELLANALQSHL